MQDQNQTDSNGATGAVGDAGSVGTDSSTDAGSPADDVIVKPMTDDTPSADASNTASEDDTKSQNAPTGQTDGAMNDVASKINDANNILVALSSNPTVDDLSSAIGLSLSLERAGKRAVAIYSGKTPNAMEFLNPSDTLKATADTLQDFVIAINKDKADHLRYKLDGDFVKIFITPYKTRIAEEDLEFSYGDFNIDLVIAINVASESVLDDALREQGRVLHDATVINITTSAPGSLGNIEWSNPGASSVSEMIAQLLYSMGGDVAVEKDDATALLTGIIASTDRFFSANTSPETMQIASQLMASGADQKLITENITSDLKDKILGLADNVKKADAGAPVEAEPSTAPAIESLPPVEMPATETVASENVAPETSVPVTSAPETVAPETATPETAAPDTVAPDTTTPETPVAETSAPETPVADVATPETTAPETATPETLAPETATLETPVAETPAPMVWLTDEKPGEDKPDSTSADASLPPVQDPTTPLSFTPNNFTSEVKSETVVAPSADFAEEVHADSSKYGQMLQDALAESSALETPVATPAPSAPVLGGNTGGVVAPTPIADPLGGTSNPALSMAPPVADKPEINGVPEINYASSPNDSVLPPPPAPPVDINGMPPTSVDLGAPVLPDLTAGNPPVAPAPDNSVAPVAPQPDQPASPSDFKIPGM